MSEIICVTNRALCKGDFLERMKAIAGCAPAGIILREKDLSKEEYHVLARQVMEICKQYRVPCILHFYADVAVELKAQAFHAPLSVLRNMTDRQRFSVLGASCHSVREAVEAQQLGCTYIVAGHIFSTDCKKGVPPRGLSFLREVCSHVTVPVYAIGGINSENFAAVTAAGAKGGCVMSGWMTCENAAYYNKKFREKTDEDSIDNCRE